MDLSLYSEEIQEFDRRQDEYLSILDERAIPILNEMLKAAMKTNDPTLIGYVCHTLSFAEFFISGRYKKFTRYLRLASKYIREGGNEAELTHVYYLMALDALNKGMIDISHRFFLESRSLAGKIGLQLATAIMDMNIAQLLIQIGSYEEARKHVKTCINAIRSSRNHIYHYKNLTALYMEDVLISMELGEIDQAVQIMNKAERHISKHRELLTGAAFLKYEITRLRLELLGRRTEGSAERVELLCETIRSTPNLYSYMGDLMSLCSLLIKKKHYVTVRRIIDAIECNRPEEEATRALELFVKIKVDYYKAIGDETGLEAAYKEHDQVLSVKIRNRKEIYRYVTDLARFTGNIRRNRKTAISEQDKLTQIARIDDLTSIPNRFGANLHLDEAFERAYQQKTRLGVVYLDLDGLKFINDTQGHLAGDECLKEMGRLLSSHMEAGEFYAARYGGDEFLLIYENATTKEIKNSLAAMKNESSIRFSGGIQNAVPKGREKSWQYIELADKALYEEKKKK